MPSLLEFILLVLATWRITSLVSLEDGPWDILAKFRYIVGVRYDEYSQPTIFKNTFAKGIVCVWCVSVWFAFIGAFLSPYTANVLSFIENWFAISALVILFNEFTNLIARLHRQ